MSEQLIEQLKDKLAQRDRELHWAATRCQRGRINDIIQIIQAERTDACCKGEELERLRWHRLGPFAVSINWWPLRWWRSRK